MRQVSIESVTGVSPGKAANQVTNDEGGFRDEAEELWNSKRRGTQGFRGEREGRIFLLLIRFTGLYRDRQSDEAVF